MKVRFHPMKGTNKSSLVLLSKKSAICDKLVNASNLKLLHGLSLKTTKLKLSKLFQLISPRATLIDALTIAYLYGIKMSAKEQFWRADLSRFFHR